MKKTILTLTLVAATVAAFAQGKVGFNNDSTRTFVIGAPAGLDQSGPITASSVATPLSALLYAGTSAGSLSLQTAIDLAGSNLPNPGRMAVKNVVLTGVPGGTLQFFQIVIADTGIAPATILGGADRAAFDTATYFGTSGLFQFTPGTSIVYPPIYAGSSTWAAGDLVVNAAVIPEPSSMVLAGLGAASLLLFRRRK